MANTRLLHALELAGLVWLVLAGCKGEGAPTIQYFRVQPYGLPVDGGTVTASWEVFSATALFLDAGTGQLTLLTPVTVASTTAVVTADTVFTLSASNSAGTVSRSVPVCVASAPVSVALTAPASYGCGDSFQGELVLTNGSCYDVRVGSISLSFMLNACPISGGSWVGGTVSPGSWADVLSGPHGSICCATSPCTLHCSDTAIWTLSTTAGMLTVSAPFIVDLENCSGQVCH